MFLLYFFLLSPFLFINSAFKEIGYNLILFINASILFLLLYFSLLLQNTICRPRFSTTIHSFFLIIIIIINFSMQYLGFSIYLLVLVVSVILLTSIKYLFTTRKIVPTIIFFYFIVSFILSNFSIGYLYTGTDLRFTGMFLSATTFGITSLYLFIYFLYNSKNRYMKLVLYIILIYLIYLSQSRLNLLVVVLLPIVFTAYYLNFFNNDMKYFILILLIVSLMYPLYQYVQSIYEVSSTRGNAEASDSTRFFYSLKILSNIDFYNISFYFGHGTGSAIDIIGHDNIKPHNDFLRIVYDYGIIFFIFFNTILYRFFIMNIHMAMMVIIYIFSFYHNMIFDSYSILLIVFLSKFTNLHNSNTNEKGFL